MKDKILMWMTIQEYIFFETHIEIAWFLSRKLYNGFGSNLELKNDSEIGFDGLGRPKQIVNVDIPIRKRSRYSYRV